MVSLIPCHFSLPDEGGGSACPEGLNNDGTGVCRQPCEVHGPESDAPCGPTQICDLGWCRPADAVDGGVPGGGDAGTDGSTDGSRTDGAPDSGFGDGAVADSGTCSPGVVDGGTSGSLHWVCIPGGSFQMGSDGGDGNERPIHPVTIPSFAMLRTEVTVAQYGEC
jgi:hypothetical protein